MPIEADLIEKLLLAHAAQASPVLEMHSAEDVASALMDVSDEAAGIALGSCTPSYAVSVIKKWPVEKVTGPLEQMTPSVIANLLRRAGEPLLTHVLNALPGKKARDVKTLLSHEPDTAGGLMDSNPPVVREEETVARALQRLRDEETSRLKYIYVVNATQRLVGVIDQSVLLNSDPADLVAKSMSPVKESLPPKAGSRAIMEHPGWQHLRALPVIDNEERLLGVIRFDTYMAVVQMLRGKEALLKVSTADALGDLFFTGFSGLLQSAIRASSRSDREQEEFAGDSGTLQTEGES